MIDIKIKCTLLTLMLYDYLKEYFEHFSKRPLARIMHVTHKDLCTVGHLNIKHIQDHVIIEIDQKYDENFNNNDENPESEENFTENLKSLCKKLTIRNF